MNDREMLEYAAKAAGIDGVWQDWDGMGENFGFMRLAHAFVGTHSSTMAMRCGWR